MISYEGWDREYQTHAQDYIQVFDSFMRQTNYENPQRLEDQMCNLLGRSHAVGVANATDALFFALQALGVGKGDEVLVTSFSWISTASAITRAGAVPVFCDIDASSYHMSLSSMQRMLSPRTRAVVYAHLFGNMVNMEPIRDFCHSHQLWFVEDAAQNLGSSFAGRLAGTWGDVSVISFNTNKAVAGVNGGGMALTDVEHLAQVIRQLSRHGRRGSDSEFLGYNSRLYCLNSEIISLRLQHMWEWQRSRQAVAHTYNQAFADLPLVTQRCTEQLNHNFHKYVVGFPDQLTRNRVQKALNAAVHYDPPLNAHTMYASMPHRSDGKCAVANWVSQRVLSLPVHPWLLPEEIDHVIATVRNHV